jgi:NADH:ubiquinone oxidoreductase subunit C
MTTNINNINIAYYEALASRYVLYFGFCDYVKINLTKWISKISINIIGVELEILKNGLVPLIFFLQLHTNSLYNYLLDITAMDLIITPERRFRLMYQLCSVHHNARVTVILYTKESELVPTITHLFRSAGWFECEIWDFFGVFFAGNINLHRILTDYGFRQFPLRKDFPVSGYSEVYYNVLKKRVGYYRISLMQEYRIYTFPILWI